MKPEAVPSKPKDEGPDQYQIESWVRTVMEADEIKHDDEKWALVRPHLEKKAKAAVSTLDSLREKGKKMHQKEMDDADPGQD